jgi:hypothetical protein
MNLTIFCFCLFFVGIHTVYGLPLGGETAFPFILCGIASALALPSILPQLLRLRLKTCWPMIAYLALATLITAVAAEPGFFVRSIRGILGLYYSVAVASCLFFMVSLIPRQKMATVCLIICVIMALASLLEFLGPLRNTSDTFRALVSPNWGYDADERDLAMHGAVRSKVFTPEPSLAATSFFWISMLYLCSMTINYRQLLLWFVAAITMLWTVRSPTLIAAMACSFISFFIFHSLGAGKRLFTRRNLTILLVCLAIVASVAIAAHGIFEARIASISSGEEGSFIMRETGALQFAAEYVTKHPILGTGVVGDLEMLSNDIVSFLTSLSVVIDMGTISGITEARKAITNVIALHFIYYGGVGGLVELAFLFASLYLRNRCLFALLLFQVVVFSMSGGGYNGPPIWCISSSLLAAAKLKEVSLRESEVRRAWRKIPMVFAAPIPTLAH